MKVTCPISGIKYALANPLRGHAVHTHPMLSPTVKATQLAEWYLEDWAKGDLADDLTHLLGMSFVLKLPVESVALSAVDSLELESLAKFWAVNLEGVSKLALKLDGRNKEFKRLPRFAVRTDTLDALPDWLEQLKTEMAIASNPISEKAKELNRESYKVGTEISARTISQYLEPDQIDGIVLRALRNSPLAKSESKALPVILADWANKVTDFPHGNTTRWQKVIQVIFDPDYINLILMSDIRVEQVKQIEEHLQLNMPAHAVGTSHCELLMKRIDAVIPVLEDFNPMVSARKKTNEDALLASLFGDEPSERSKTGATQATGSSKPNSGIANNSNSANPATKPLTLSERLAARMAGLKDKG